MSAVPSWRPRPLLPRRPVISSTFPNSTAPPCAAFSISPCSTRTAAENRALAGRTLALLFENQHPHPREFRSRHAPAWRTRNHPHDRDMQLGRGETVGDTARVLSRYVDCIMLRTDRVWKLNELAQFATVPVINGLTEASHPCQLMADIMTFEEHRGPITGRRLAWLGTATTSPAVGFTPPCASAFRSARLPPPAGAAGAIGMGRQRRRRREHHLRPRRSRACRRRRDHRLFRQHVDDPAATATPPWRRIA